jgi:hypothetical protein
VFTLMQSRKQASAMTAWSSARRRRSGTPFPRADVFPNLQIAGRSGRWPATVKPYFYDTTGENARAVKRRYHGTIERRWTGSPNS